MKMVKTYIKVRLETLVVNQLVRKTNVAHTGQITDASVWCRVGLWKVQMSHGFLLRMGENV